MFNIFNTLKPGNGLTKVSKYRSKKQGLSSKIRYWGFIEDGFMLNSDSSLMTCYWYRGEDLATASAEYMAAVSAYINRALMHLTEGWAMHVDCVCYESTGYISEEECYFPHPVLKLIDDERREIYESEGSHYENAYVITLTWLPPKKIARQFARIYSSGKNKDIIEEALYYYKKCCTQIINGLTASFPFIKQMNNQEMLTYLHRSITGKSHIVNVPDKPVYLQRILASQDYSHRDAKIGNKYIQVVAICGFPKESYPAILDTLNNLGIGEYSWRTRWKAMRPDKAKREADRIIKYWAANRLDFKGWIAVEMAPGSRVQENPDALDKEADATAALGEITGGYVTCGYYTTQVVIMDEDLEQAIKRAEQVQSVFEIMGFPARLETVNCTDAFFGSLPGHTYENVRKPMLNSLVLSDFLPITAVWTGLSHNPCPLYANYNNPPLMITSSGICPFRLNLHVDDVGHTLIIGPSGSGKSTLVANLIAQHFRYKQAQVFCFDKDFSLLPLCYAMDGSHYNLLTDDKLKFQPLKPPRIKNVDGSPADLSAFIAWAQGWIEDLCRVNNVQINVTRSKIIYEAISNVLAIPDPKRWRMDELHSAIQGDEEIKDVIRLYTEMGNYSFFDGEADLIANNRMVVFEMGSVMRTKNEALIFATATYLFEKFRQQLTGAPFLLIIEEGPIFFRNPVFAEKISEWLMTLRKANVAVIIITPSLGELLKSGYSEVLFEQCPTKIYLANPEVKNPQGKQQYQRIGLQDAEIDVIGGMIRKQEYYITNPLGKRVFSLNLSWNSTPASLCFTGKSSVDDIREAIKIKQEYGKDFSAQWLLHNGYQSTADKLRKLDK